MNKSARLRISIFAVLFLLACACPVSSLPAIGDQPAISVPAIPPTQPQVPADVPQQNLDILIRDDFSVESSEMETYSDENGSVETKNGVYSVRSEKDLWNWGSSESMFSDLVIDFDATLVTGPANNNAGIGAICRMQTRDDNSIDGYLLAISGDGYYSIRNISSGSMTPLVDWTFSDVINQGKVGNKLRASCNGSELSLEVNGSLVATTSISTSGLTSGAFAFAAISFETTEPISEVHFDNLVISKPK